MINLNQLRKKKVKMMMKILKVNKKVDQEVIQGVDHRKNHNNLKKKVLIKNNKKFSKKKVKT